MAITKTDVDKLPPNSIVWDAGKGAVAGFGVRRQRRFPIFVVKYSIGGRQRWHTIGRNGAPWTVDQARLEAKRILGRIAAGEDPAIDRQTARAAITPMVMSDLCDRYLSAASSGIILTRFNRPKKASTLAIDLGRVERHIKPLIGLMPVSDVDGRVVKRLIEDITLGKTAVDIKTKTRGRAMVTGGAATATRVADLLSGIMTWAVDEGIVTANPVHKIRRFRSEPRQRFLSDSELAQLGVALRVGVSDTGQKLHPYIITILTILCLTGCRASEIAALRWSEVDLEQRCLRLADTKSGGSLRAIGKTPLGLLAAQVRNPASDFVFPATRGPSNYQGLKKDAPRLFKAASLVGVTSHVLRHTFASVASELGYSDGTIAGLLGHKGRGVTSRYIHRPDTALVMAAEVTSAAIWSRINQGA